MKQRVITGVIFAVLFAAFFLPAFWFPITAVIMSLIVGSFVVYELIKALKNGKYDPSTSLIITGCALALIRCQKRRYQGFGERHRNGRHDLLCYIPAVLPGCCNAAPA